MKDVFEFLVDGTSGLAPGGVEGACIVVGVCSVGEVGKAYLLGTSSDLTALLGVGPLVDRLRDLFAAAGQGPAVIAVPAQGQGGSVTAVVKTGSGPEIVTAGTPKADADVVMQILSAGGRNVGTYRLSLDGEDNWGPERTIPVDGVIAVGSTGVNITFPEVSAAVAGDLYTFAISAPTPTVTAVLEALEQPLALYDVEFVYVVGPSDSTDWAALGAKADELWNAHRPTFFVAESRLPNAAEDLDTWTAAMMSEGSGYAHRFVAVCSAFGEIADSTGKRLTRNAAGLLAGRLLAIPVMRAPGRVRDGAVSQLTLPDRYTETHQSQLEAAGFVTARRYAGLSGTYWGDERTLADVTSDYQYLTVLRTVFKAVRKCRIAALKSMYDEAGDPVLEGGAIGLEYLKTNLETALNTMVSAIPKELAGHVVDIPSGQDIINNGVAVEMTLIGLPIIRTIKLFASYVYAGGSFDPRLQ